MEWSKIKNIVLLILAAVNVILLGLVLQRKQEMRRYEEELRASTVAVLAEQKIVVSQELVPWEEKYTAQTVLRSTEAEAALAEQLLGTCELVDTSPYTYAGEAGSIRFRSNGEFVLQYTGDAPFGEAAEGTEADHSRTLLQELGMAAEVTGEERDGGSVRITVRQTWSGRPLFDCTSQLEYQNGRLRQISGKYLFGALGGEGEKTLSAASLLIDFMGEVVSTGEVCNEITAIETGYVTTATLHDAAMLKPVWHITTDTGLFELDSMAGTCKRVN